MSNQIDKIIYPNVHEVVRRSMPWRTFSDSFLQTLRDAGAAYSELGLLWGGDNKIVVLPKPIPQIQIDYIKEILGYRNIQVSISGYHEGTLCSITKDIDNYFEDLPIPKKHAKVSCYFWGVSDEVYTVINNLKAKGYGIETPDIPSQKNYKIVELFDSKVTFRSNLIQEKLDIDFFKYEICSQYEQVEKVLKSFVENNKPFVIKSEFGVGGYGNIFFDKKIIKSGFKSCLKTLRNATAIAPYIASDGLVFEEMANKKYFNLETISCLAFIDSNGKCLINGVIKELRILGYYSGAETITNNDSILVSEKTMEIGQVMSENGYRGYFCTDYFISNNKKIILLEINPRRCSSHYIFEIGNRLYNSNYVAKHFLSLPIRYIKNHNNITERIIDIFRKINNNLDNYIAIPTQINGLTSMSPYIGFLLLGVNSEFVELLHKNILSELNDNDILLGAEHQ